MKRHSLLRGVYIWTKSTVCSRVGKICSPFGLQTHLQAQSDLSIKNLAIRGQKFEKTNIEQEDYETRPWVAPIGLTSISTKTKQTFLFDQQPS